jgi:hypothetical protein
MLSKFERAVVLDTNVRRLVRRGMRPGTAMRHVARHNGVEFTEVLGAVLDVRQVDGLEVI